MRPYRFTRAPRPLRSDGVTLDNMVLVPAALLPDKAQWQQLANALPRGDILIVLPRQAKQRRIVRCVADHLRERGKQVAVMDQELHRSTP